MHSGSPAHSFPLYWCHRRGIGERREGRKGERDPRPCFGRCLWEWPHLCCEPGSHQTLPPAATPATTRRNPPWMQICPWPQLSSVGYWGRKWLPAAPHLWFASRLWVCLSAERHHFELVWLPGSGDALQESLLWASLTGSFQLLHLWIHYGFHAKATLTPSCPPPVIRNDQVLEPGHSCAGQGSSHGKSLLWGLQAAPPRLPQNWAVMWVSSCSILPPSSPPTIMACLGFLCLLCPFLFFFSIVMCRVNL